MLWIVASFDWLFSSNSNIILSLVTKATFLFQKGIDLRSGFWCFKILLWGKCWDLLTMMESMRYYLLVIISLFIERQRIIMLIFFTLLLKVVIINFIRQILKLYTNFTYLTQKGWLNFIILLIVYSLIGFMRLFLFQFILGFIFICAWFLWLLLFWITKNIFFIGKVFKCLIRSWFLIELISNNFDSYINQLF